MSTTGTMTARQWAQLMGLALLAILTLLVVVAVVLPVSALVMAVALLVVGAAFVAQRASGMARATRAAVTGAPAPDAAQPTLRLELPDGAVVSARLVPLPVTSEHTLLLTRDGYVVVSAEGKLLHRL